MTIVPPPPANPTARLDYAMSASPDVQRRWRIAFRFGVLYLLLLGVIIAFQVRPMMNMIQMLSEAPLHEPFMIGIVLLTMIPMAMMCSNILAVVGYARAARGRSPRRIFLVYALTQAGFCVLGFAVAAALMQQRSYNYSATRGSSTIALSWYSLLVLPIGFALFSLPLVAMIFRPVRRGCFS